jgi:cell pole-organizing protein PopZ
MSDGNEHWNPEDGPPPTEEELAEARALAQALSAPAESHEGRAEPELRALLDVALRVRATAHPNEARTDAITASAVQHALTHAEPRWYRSRWRWAALAASVLLGVGGTQLALLRAGTESSRTISHRAHDEFDAPLPNDPRSGPIGRITDARTRAYRDTLLHAPVSEGETR